MAITCLRLNADVNFDSERTLGNHTLVRSPNESLAFRHSGEDELNQGNYRDILNLTRLLIYGPESKLEVDIVIERYNMFCKSKKIFFS